MPSPGESPKIKTDHLIIGSGVAGLNLALNLAKSGKVIILTKSSLIDNNSWHAQGGIASVLDKSDSFENHIEDTLAAGAGLCHRDVVAKVVEAGPKAIADLIKLGANFTKTTNDLGDEYQYHLTKEGGHSQRRVIHAEDLTGRELVTVLAKSCSENPNIDIYEDQFAIDLMTSDKIQPEFHQNSCLGAYVLDRTSGGVYSIISGKTYLCTGGHGKVYLYTSNPDSATGDGLAMAWRAGCRVGNLEFMQFHPTCLYHPQAKNFLLSEALRGEGAILRNQQGRAFVEDYHPMGSLAPRDIVARAIDFEMKKTGQNYVYLDARPIGEDKIAHHFPNLKAVCAQFGYDMASDLIPVVPAAHYSCGGIIVDDHGCTSLRNLYAIGETACTGLHGANRLASNSLLEALVFAQFAAEHALASSGSGMQDGDLSFVPDWQAPEEACVDEICVLNHIWDEIRRMMWNYVGIVRTTKRLERAMSRITSLRQELNHYYWSYRVSGSVLEVRNLADVAFLTIQCAMKRKESRGIHFTQDYPDQNAQAIDTIV